jgi:hypothetical protein
VVIFERLWLESAGRFRSAVAAVTECGLPRLEKASMLTTHAEAPLHAGVMTDANRTRGSSGVDVADRRWLATMSRLSFRI